ncbi:hypothetical protein BVC80_8793g3 [Macleaya cordata]|uniref:Uncharacterized protein n=1 Tax=Macleaya cordata TaxID=56857 RepID=A0A200PSZ8_MACCD|nr:hypothetical protein BVC80_8793g3 [Macleaya cordata]
MATQRQGARFQQQNQFIGGKRQRVHGESSQGQRTTPPARAPQSPARPEGKPNQNQNRQQQQPQQPQQQQRDLRRCTNFQRCDGR